MAAVMLESSERAANLLSNALMAANETLMSRIVISSNPIATNTNANSNNNNYESSSISNYFYDANNHQPPPPSPSPFQIDNRKQATADYPSNNGGLVKQQQQNQNNKSGRSSAASLSTVTNWPALSSSSSSARFAVSSSSHRQIRKPTMPVGVNKLAAKSSSSPIRNNNNVIYLNTNDLLNGNEAKTSMTTTTTTTFIVDEPFNADFSAPFPAIVPDIATPSSSPYFSTTTTRPAASISRSLLATVSATISSSSSSSSSSSFLSPLMLSINKNLTTAGAAFASHGGHGQVVHGMSHVSSSDDDDFLLSLREGNLTSRGLNAYSTLRNRSAYLQRIFYAFNESADYIDLHDDALLHEHDGIDLEALSHAGMLALIIYIVAVNLFTIITLTYGIKTPIAPLTIRTLFFMQNAKQRQQQQQQLKQQQNGGVQLPLGLLSPQFDFYNCGNELNGIINAENGGRSPLSVSAKARAAAKVINHRRLAITSTVNSSEGGGDIPNMDCSTFPYLLSLAISDLAIGVVIAPLQFQTFRLNGHWELGPLWCDLWRAADIFFCTCSALHTAVIAVDRWWALSRAHSQFRWSRRVNMQRTMLIFPWFLSAMVSFPVMFVWQIEAPDAEVGKRNADVCEPVMDNVYIILSAMVSFFLPLATTISFYVQVVCAMRKRLEELRDEAGGILDNTADFFMSSRLTGYHSAAAKKMTEEAALRIHTRRVAQRRIRDVKQHKALLQSMAVVVLFYCLCWAPLYTTLFIQAICACPESAWDFWLSLFTWLGYANSAVNPAIYFCTLYEFRLLSITIVKIAFKYVTDAPLILINHIRYGRAKKPVPTSNEANIDDAKFNKRQFTWLRSATAKAAAKSIGTQINDGVQQQQALTSTSSMSSAGGSTTTAAINGNNAAITSSSTNHNHQQQLASEDAVNNNVVILSLELEPSIKPQSALTAVTATKPAVLANGSSFANEADGSSYLFVSASKFSGGSLRNNSEMSSSQPIPQQNQKQQPNHQTNHQNHIHHHHHYHRRHHHHHQHYHRSHSYHTQIDDNNRSGVDGSPQLAHLKSPQNSPSMMNNHGGSANLFAYYDEWGRPVNAQSREASASRKYGGSNGI